MKAVHMLGNSQVEVIEYPVPTPAAEHVLVRVGASGICGGEIKGYRAPDPQPMNGGHEVAGTVEDPNGHPQWDAGDRVGIFTIQGCGYCRWCRQGRDTFCDQVGVPASTHAEYTISRATGMVKLPEDISFELGVMLCGDGLGVPYGSAMRAGVEAGDITCVFGCGPVGLGMVLVQAYLGAKVIAVEPVAHRRDLALKMGAWRVVDPAAEPNLVGWLKDVTDGVGPDSCFEAVGRQDTLDVAMDVTRPEGTIIVVGHGPQSLDPQRLIIRRNLAIAGNWVAHPAWFPQMLEMVRCGLDVERLITARYALDDAPTAYARLADGLEAKVMLLP